MPPRVLLAIGLSGALVVAALVFAGLATRRLDPLVLTQSMKSLRYRGEYWQGAWGVITEGAPSFAEALTRPTFWWGVGPGNFAGPYLKHMLATASEEIVDPHNLLLEVWATAGVFALLCLLAAVAWAFWNFFGPASPAIAARTEVDRLSRRERRRARAGRRDGFAAAPHDDLDDRPPARTGWLMLSAGAGWALVVVFGWLDPFQADLFPRWLILGAAWLTAALLCMPLWNRLPIPALALAAGAITLLVTLLASGGIGIPTVALGLWSIIALGQNLRDDRECSSLREYESRMPSLGMAVAWSAAFGTFIGLVTPFWQCEAAVARGEAAMRLIPPNYEAAHDVLPDARSPQTATARAHG